ncbi:pyridoxal phosphate-dependent decarboxylase family protein [Rhodopirellula sp. JC639]|uniref:pyridoxal phosphate-dependent decarboxylase family protein n=1 Tax=Stieleria mannarensis TaxID=2755585 RepID=UPI00160250D4|nr:pyridoxal-dependent decarboxylase [Rhodopirellula sp. JC639]
MDRNDYRKLVDTFFKWDQESIVTILEELLSAAATEHALHPAHAMSQNYETAKANPEIHMLPGNLKDARDAVFPYFWGTDSFNSPLHLENVRGPANNASLIGAFACLLKNPNLCTDRYSQRSNELEVKSVTALANLIFYHTDDPWGVFTIGGTISNLYGAKIGIERVVPGAMQNGIGGQRVVGFCSEASHYSNRTVAGWLGIGVNNLIAIPTDAHLSIRVDLLEQQLDECYQNGTKVAYVVASFGTTDGFGIDDLAAIRTLLDAKSTEYQQPTPQLHVDAAVGWALSFLADYDLGRNTLGFSDSLLSIVKRVQEACKGLRVVDSATIDFHKLGRGHYPSSAFLVNHRRDLKYLAREVTDTPYFSEAQASRDPALITLECSRPALGPYIVMASLNGIGLTGWQMLTARSLELAERLKQGLETLPYCKVLNRETIGVSVDWWVLPKGRDAERIYRQLVEGTLPDAEREQYFAEVARTQRKREKMMDPKVDARLGFTTNFGFKPFGIEIPAWKAVFMNPATDEEMVDRILWSVEESA